MFGTEEQMSDVLNLLNWSGGHGNRFTHDWFRFPGKFHPPLVENILRSLKPNAVADPMSGVGTVAVEAKAAGIPSISTDVDPVSVFFVNVKTTPISQRTLKSAWRDLSNTLVQFRRSDAEIATREFQDIRTDAMRKQLAAAKSADLECLTYWFRRYVMVDYARIDHSIFNGGLPERSHRVRNFFLACLISTIRRISLADPTPVSGLEITSHMKKKIARGYNIDVFAEFERRVDRTITRMEEYTEYLKQKGTYDTVVRTAHADCIELSRLFRSADVTPNLILFSPPYCNAIEYWRRHQLEYYLGGFLAETSEAELKSKFIGRTNVGRDRWTVLPTGLSPLDRILSALIEDGRDHKARVLTQYFVDMGTRLEVFYDCLPKNGHCIVVIGDSTTAGRKIPTGQIITSLAELVGFKRVKTSRYKIKNRVMQFPLKTNVRIEHESIIVLRK